MATHRGFSSSQQFPAAALMRYKIPAERFLVKSPPGSRVRNFGARPLHQGPTFGAATGYGVQPGLERALGAVDYLCISSAKCGP
jgi:hypothetical protein